MDLRFIKPSIEYKKEILEFREVFLLAGDNIMNGCGYLNRYSHIEVWLSHIKSYEHKDKIDPNTGFVEGSQWMLIDMDTRYILGMTNIRHYLNDTLLKTSGHIGYSIRPDERKKGYGRLQLQYALDFLHSIQVEKALVTCDEDNIASYKTIESCGGVLENITLNEKKGTLIRRYWIETDKNKHI